MNQQGSNDPFKPKERADVDRRVSDTAQQRPRKFPDGKKLRKKNSQGAFTWDVTVVSARYDNIGHTWWYTLKDWQKKDIDGQTPEKQLG
ncbi:hypothetical protein ABVK25_004091 [Lepraria finkii]|uniref:Transposase n=1 Tax=Lepraria finkii TaxID=1340010 RepID=A0ABR4BEK4_9LECA